MSSQEMAGAKRKEIRCAILRLLDTERPEFVGETLLIRGLYNLKAGRNEVRKELLYLKQKNLVALQEKAGEYFVTLLAVGVDVLEGAAPLAGLEWVEVSLSKVEIERRREIRWRLLRAADASSPIALVEGLAQRVLRDLEFHLLPQELRRVACYLEQKNLLDINRANSDEWLFLPTAEGTDVCDYSIDCPPGIARPEKYW